MLREALACCLAMLVLVPSAARASPAPTSSTHVFRIPSQPLEAALQEFARQSGAQLIFFSAIAEGRQAGALDGEYTVAAALTRLLSDSLLAYRVVNSSTVEIVSRPRQRQETFDTLRRLPEQSGPLQEVIVRATAQDVVATRTETPLRKIPQTVSVVSLAQIQEQSLVNVADAMDQVPGVTTTRLTTVDKQFLSRGFQVTSFHVDGSASLVLFNEGERVPRRPDLAEFERIEVLRGADGLFSGNGEPGASINLVRKRPPATPALRGELQVGSWGRNRVELDATGALAFGDSLRGRMIAVHDDEGHFFDKVTYRRNKLFAVLEYDITPDTPLTLGGSYDVDDSVPSVRGLPVNIDGSDPHLPRDYALAFGWSYQRSRTREAYLQLQHSFGEDWKLRFGTALWDATLDYDYAFLLTRSNPTTGGYSVTGVQAQFTPRPNDLDQLGTDVTLTGRFELFGLGGEVALGGEYARYRIERVYDIVGANVGANIDLLHLSPSLIPDPRLTETPVRGSNFSGEYETAGAFASVRLHLGDAWSVTAGARAGKDHVSTTGKEIPWTARTITPYAAVMYDVGEHYSLYASYADIYRNAKAEIFNTLDNQTSLIQPDGGVIGVRHGVNIEAGIKAAWREGALNGTLVGYSISQYRVPIALPSSLGGGSLPGVSHSQGADLELSGMLMPGWLLGAGYAYNENRKPTAVWQGVRGPLYAASELSSRTPKHSFKIWTRKQLSGEWSRWAIGGNLRAQTEQMREAGQCTRFSAAGFCQATTTVKRMGAPYAVLDLRAGVQLDSNWRVGLAVNNVFDKWYYESLGNLQTDNWYGEPRNFLLKVEAAF